MPSPNIPKPNLKKHLNAIKNLEHNISITQPNINKLEEYIAKLVAKMPEYEKQLVVFKQNNELDKISVVENTIKNCKEEISERNTKLNNLKASLKSFQDSIKKHAAFLEKYNNVETDNTNMQQEAQSDKQNIDLDNVSTTKVLQTKNDNDAEPSNKINVLELYIERAITQLNNIDS